MKKMLKTAAYLKAPKKTWAALHPVKTALVTAATWSARRVLPERMQPAKKGSSTMSKALKGAGAAAVMVPVGLWLGRKRRRGTETPAQA